jgi:hypothetical protein
MLLDLKQLLNFTTPPIGSKITAGAEGLGLSKGQSDIFYIIKLRGSRAALIVWRFDAFSPSGLMVAQLGVRREQEVQARVS